MKCKPVPLVLSFFQILLLVGRVQSQDNPAFFEQYKYCVALVESIQEGETRGAFRFVPHGTAFWVLDRDRGIYVVSNRHVFDTRERVALQQYSASEAESPRIILNLRDDEGNPLWVAHPDPLVDIAVVRADSFLVLGERKPKATKVQSSLFATREEIVEGDDVFFLGFPLGIRTDESSFPVLRAGTVSLKPTRDFLFVRTPGGPVRLGKEVYLVDAVSIGGSSGSPVFLRPGINRPYLDPGRIEVTKTKLVGIVSGHVLMFEPLVALEDSLSVFARLNAGLAIVHPADQILDVIRLAK